MRGISFSNMTQTPLRKPWVGSEYESQKNKVLFVAESSYSKNHFDENKDNANLTIACVEQYSNYEWGNRTWDNMISNFGEIFGITAGEEKSRKKFFDKISHTNYIQHLMMHTGESPFNYYIHNEQYRQHLYNTIEEVKPDCVILISQRLNDLWAYEGCGIVQHLKDNKIGYYHTKHLSRISNVNKLEIQKIVQEIIAK